MSRILVLSSDSTIARALSGAGHEVCMAQSSASIDEYDLILAPASYFSMPNISGSSEDHRKMLLALFASRDGKLESYLDRMSSEIASAAEDKAQAKQLADGICTGVIDAVFEKHEWLELYLSQDEFTAANDKAAALLRLHKDFTELLPLDGGSEEELVLYILNNPESDIRQKTLASKMYMNSSYISTVFAAKTGGRFVDYLTTVKLRRAAYLLTNSTLKVNEIAARLDYKDIGYFSRMFKARYGMTPSAYRMPQDYIYVI